MAGDFGPLALQLEGLIGALDRVGMTVEGASVGLQVKLDKATDRLADKFDDSIKRLVRSLDDSAKAANEATKASTRYAGRLVWATWALVAVTVVLAVVTALDHLSPDQTPRQRDCSEVAAWIAAQSPQATKGHEYRQDPIFGAPNAAPWANHSAAVEAYFSCLK